MRLDAGAPGAIAIAASGAGEPEAAPPGRYLAFSSRFRSFFRLKTPRNLK